MNRVTNIFELKPIVFTIFIIIVVITTGGLLYKRLTLISNKIIEPINLHEPPSFLARQIILDLRVAENNARSFQLTQDANYITLLYHLSTELEQNITTLKRIGKLQQINRSLIDSFANLSHLRFELIKTQSSLSDPSRVAEELNVINSKIEENYPSNISAKNNTVATNIDSSKRKKGLIKRLFNKDKKENIKKSENDFSKSEATVDLVKTKNQLKKEVLKVKATQIKKLEAYKKNEYEFNKASFIISEKMNYIANEFKRIEDVKSKQAARKAQLDINDIKNNAIVFSIILSLFLFMLAYLIVSYIRKRQQYETALIESKKHSDELAKAKELFLANMSHEIKTPLNAIYGFTEQLLSTDLNSEQKSQINIVKNSAEYLSKLVTDILTYSKLQSGKIKMEYENFNLINVLFEIESLFKVQAANKNIAFNIDSSQVTQNHISTDIYKFKQILFNIVGNAIKFTNRGNVLVNVSQQKKRQYKLFKDFNRRYWDWD